VPETPLHERIRQAILTLALAPGQRLSERGLEPDFGASRTPIRAALMRLESEGLVRRDPAGGWSVSPIDIDEITSLSEYREILESASVRLAIDRASDDDFEGLRDLASSSNDEETPEHGIDTGTSFHLELARLAGNEHVGDAMAGILTRLYRTRWLEVQTPQSRERVSREHASIAEALLAGDAAAAELALVEHLRGTHHRLVETLQSGRPALRARGIALDGGR
jgi:DNA-binding GntR family transcriptional regulator